MALYLLRHAHTPWNGPPRRFQGRADIPLSDQGREACLAFRESLTLQPDLIVSSPAQRCQETTRLIFPERDYQLDDRLLEIDNGYFSGLYEHEVAERYPDEWARWLSTPGEIRPGGGELLAELGHRFETAINEWKLLAENQNVLIVTHGGPIRVLHLVKTQQDLNRFHETTCGNLALVELSTAET